MSRRNHPAHGQHAVSLDHSVFGVPNLAMARLPRTQAIRRALARSHSHTEVDDLLFLEAWEWRASADLPSLLRAKQIRRANPILAAEVRAELSRGRPLTGAEREALRPD